MLLEEYILASFDQCMCRSLNYISGKHLGNKKSGYNIDWNQSFKQVEFRSSFRKKIHVKCSSDGWEFLRKTFTFTYWCETQYRNYL